MDSILFKSLSFNCLGLLFSSKGITEQVPSCEISECGKCVLECFCLHSSVSDCLRVDD